MDYTPEWERLGYEKGMASASFLPPPRSGFIRAYHMTEAKHAVSDIANRWLKVTQFSEANDPFELLGLNCHDRHTRKRMARFKDTENRKTGLLCFTADWSNPVLWSHYGERHRGICQGFDLRQDTAEPVEYEDQRIREALTDDATPDGIPADVGVRLARTKSRHWEYEQEKRVFVDLSRATKRASRYFWPFSDEMRLAEVILGPLCPARLSAIKGQVAAHCPDAVVFKARLAFRSFRVVLDGRRKPQVPRRTAVRALGIS